MELLRAYRKYHHRVNAGFPVEFKNDVFAAHPDVAAGLVRLFSLRFDPAVRDEAAAAAVHAEILAALDGVTSADVPITVNAANECMKIYGSYGFSTEFPAERFYRDVRLLRLYEGTTQIQQLIIAKNLLRD